MVGILVAVVLSTMHYEGDVGAAGGDYQSVEVVVPEGTVEISIAHSDGSDVTILDWGAWGPDGFRGWGGGLTENAIIGVAESSRGYLPGAIPPGTWTIEVGKAKLDPAGGHYAIDVTCRDDATLPAVPRASYAAPVLEQTRRWYKGDFHVHSIQSGDAAATFDQIITLARSRGLDFANISDHNTVAQHALLAAIQPDHPDFLFLRGAEITTYSGHGNAVGIHAYVDHRLGLAGRTVANIIDDVRAQGGIFIVNHPVLELGSACIGCMWQHVDDTPWDEVTGLEILTGNYNLGVLAFFPRAIALWDMELAAGHRLAAIGGSDDHTAGLNETSTGSPIGSPTTLVLADNLSEAAIIAALEHGRTIVDLHGPDAPGLDFTLANDTTTTEIGDEVDGLGHYAFTVHVTGGSGTTIELWKNGASIAQREVTSDDFTTVFDQPPGDSLERWRVHLDRDGQPIVVTSHIYTVGGPVVTEGCGCQSTNGSSAVLFLVLGASVLLLLPRRAT
ncbi:hypothetical protein BH11MYX1_BH11MYX1_13810 [soil metagenome]